MNGAEQDTVAVVGGGRMGTGIAHALLLAGVRVRLVEVSPTAMATAEQAVRDLVAESERRGSLPYYSELVNCRFSVHDSIADLAAAQLVVEAVPEDPELKVQILAAIEDVLAPSALLATNTSSISIDQLAAHAKHPNRLVGMHFFNPVPASQLVEIVSGAASDPAAVSQAQEWVRRMAKVAITVSDSPGFASSRLGLALGLEAVRMVEAGVATAADIDTAMTLGYKHPVGPLRLTDMVGLDVRLDIATYLAEHLGPRFEPPQLLRDMVERGELGKKSGQGFYGW
jgi:3-hydroxybutyryl-CoA dehydrogenase